jgi:hypothetical protein
MESIKEFFRTMFGGSKDPQLQALAIEDLKGTIGLDGFEEAKRNPPKTVGDAVKEIARHTDRALAKWNEEEMEEEFGPSPESVAKTVKRFEVAFKGPKAILEHSIAERREEREKPGYIESDINKIRDAIQMVTDAHTSKSR